jgi:RNA polymerase sigma-70 factor (ECF subfamily)
MSEHALAELDESDLVRRAQAGDRRALDVLLRKHYGYVNAVCRRMLTDPNDAEDARQEAWMLVARMIATYQHRAAFKTWLTAIVKNVCRNKYRSNTRKDRPVEDDYIDSVLPPTPSIDDLVVTRLSATEALNAVDPVFRDVCVLRYVHDLPYDEIARVLDMKLGTVKSQISRGTDQMMCWAGSQTIAVRQEHADPPTVSKPPPGNRVPHENRDRR